MSGKIDIFLLDKLNNLIEEINIIRPKTYEILNQTLKNNLKNLPEYFKLFYPSSNNTEIEIHSDEEYQLLKDTLFIRQLEKIDLQQSIFDIAYNKLDESKRDIFDEKYNCFICSENIKHENPLFCYVCQKIFHFKCLEDWSLKKEKENEKLKCPYCKKELPLNEWKQKLDFEDNRKNDAEIINQLKRDNLIKNEIFDKFKEFKSNTSYLLKSILNKISELIKIIKNAQNNKLNDYIKELSDDNIDLQIDNISNIFFEEFNIIEEYIKNTKGLKNLENNNAIKDNKILMVPEKPIKNIKAMYYEDNQKNREKNEYRNTIELIYCSKIRNLTNIFGTEFVNFNRNNINLTINNIKTPLVDQFMLTKGENKIKLYIKNKLTNLSYMFYGCINLKNIKELKYLDTTNVKNFSRLFWGCSSLIDISCLRNWNVSNGVDFSYAFTGCSSLIDISPLATWNVSNGTNFSYMFCRCLTLIEINPLSKWRVDKGKDFSYMFSGCFLLSNLLPLKNWNIKNGKNFEGIFSQCKSLENLNDLDNWKSNSNFTKNKIK